MKQRSADVLFGLQHADMAGLSEELARKRKIADREKAANGGPIQLELVLLKQRNGVQEPLRFEYTPRFNFFRPLPAATGTPQKPARK